MIFSYHSTIHTCTYFTGVLKIVSHVSMETNLMSSDADYLQTLALPQGFRNSGAKA